MVIPMNRHEFEALWNAEKSIVADIQFRPAFVYGRVFIVDDLEVYGEGCNGLTVNMSFDCDSYSLTCHFTQPGVGAIHRYCVGGTIHGEAGRYHQHFIQAPSCIRQGLKHVVRRDDLPKKTVEEVWNIICSESKITCTGEFFAPEELCRQL